MLDMEAGRQRTTQCAAQSAHAMMLDCIYGIHHVPAISRVSLSLPIQGLFALSVDLLLYFLWYA
jgi:hypothetical protein